MIHACGLHNLCIIQVSTLYILRHKISENPQSAPEIRAPSSIITSFPLTDTALLLGNHTTQLQLAMAILGRTDRRRCLWDAKRLIWRDIYAEVIQRRSIFGLLKSVGATQNRVVLDQVSGFAEPGQLTFIMGSSGAGKSTLLNILTQKRMRGMRIFGEIAINNQLVEMGDIKKYSAYVQQDDLFIAEMTVQEQLMFAARLRMPSIFSETMRKETVEDVITMEIIEAFESSDAAKYAHYVTHVKVSSAKRKIKYVSGVGKGS
ncbi:hypothetical protein ANCCEY_04423 [Ancylostoma ceylanicum]|uniref:ABC transporter domain-containing protein n=1 Tax=Ancylostoma ceylanicum TaxID=53326 RepID=A0A0D6LZ85_9BILA|nr:hypothetical protein ANCCEY_04423 [Ancylostoma ceylanicum]